MRTYFIPKNDDLVHYGVLGMKWGIRRYQPYSVKPRGSGEGGKEIGEAIKSSKRLRKSKTANLEKWGKDSKHNILYITGFSGSGKSTATNELARKDDNIINLDLFLEPTVGETELIAPHGKDKRIRDFLASEFPEYRNLTNPKEHLSKNWFKTLDGMISKIDEFSEQEYKSGRRVIMEGVQLLDETIYPNKKILKDKPIIIMGTNPITSILSASKRDDKNIVKDILPSLNEYVNWYRVLNKDLSTLSKEVNAKKYRKNN